MTHFGLATANMDRDQSTIKMLIVDSSFLFSEQSGFNFNWAFCHVAFLSPVAEWIFFIRILMASKRKHVVFSEEEVKRHVEAFQLRKISQRRYAKESGIHESTLRRWL